MKVNDLRVGNYILFKEFGEGDGEIGSMKRGDFGRFNNEEYHPIALTPEWLKRCKFKDNGAYWEYKGEPGFVLLKDKEGLAYIGNPVRTYVKTVHHLQNLYFALTGEELQINMP